MEDYNQNMDEEDVDTEVDTHDVAVAAYNRVDALIELLIRKGIVSEDEYDKIEDELADSAAEDFAEDEEEEIDDFHKK